MIFQWKNNKIKFLYAKTIYSLNDITLKIIISSFIYFIVKLKSRSSSLFYSIYQRKGSLKKYINLLLLFANKVSVIKIFVILV